VKKSELRDVGKLMIGEFSKSPFNENVGLDDVFESLMFYCKNAEIYVADDDEILGIVVFQVEQWWEGKVAIVQDLVAVKSLEDGSVDKDLMEFLEGYCNKNGIVKIYFETNKKSSSVGLYKKMGYKINKDRIAMEKKI
jgi:hypothetical protein